MLDVVIAIVIHQADPLDEVVKRFMQTDAASAGVIRTVELLMLEEAAFWRLNESVQAKICAHVYTHWSSHPARLRYIR